MIMEERSIIMHQNQSDEETLSLCDLPIYGESSHSKNENGSILRRNYSKGDHHESEDFEFYNDEWSSPISSPADNILFCGKLIVNKGYKQSAVSENPQKLLETTEKQTQENSSVLEWNFNSRISKPHDEKDTEIRETRQNKRIISQQPEVVSGKKTDSKSRGIRWWKLIRVLGCDNLHRADAVIKSSYSCAPLIRE